jgi:hypothetical protein
MNKNFYFNQCKLSIFIVSEMCYKAKLYLILAKIKAFRKYNFFSKLTFFMSMQSSLMNLVAPFCRKVKKLAKCGNWQKYNYVTTISLYRTMKHMNVALCHGQNQKKSTSMCNHHREVGIVRQRPMGPYS